MEPLDCGLIILRQGALLMLKPAQANLRRASTNVFMRCFSQTVDRDETDCAECDVSDIHPPFYWA